MGAPHEGLAVPEKKITSMSGGGVHCLEKGACTDDTLQAVALARSLIVCRTVDPIDLIPRLLEGYCAHPACYGPTSSAVFRAILAGGDPVPSIDGIPSFGRTNGSIMRGIPLGIFYPPLRVREPSIACSRITHGSEVAGECSAFVNAMISGLCRGASRRDAFHLALEMCRSGELCAIMEQYERYPLTPSMDAVWTTHCTVRILLESGGFADAIVTAVNLGGDTDTIGAVTGGLAGAAWGLGSIPEEWLATLQDSGILCEIARELVTVSCD